MTVEHRNGLARIWITYFFEKIVIPHSIPQTVKQIFRAKNHLRTKGKRLHFTDRLSCLSNFFIIGRDQPLIYVNDRDYGAI